MPWPLWQTRPAAFRSPAAGGPVTARQHGPNRTRTAGDLWRRQEVAVTKKTLDAVDAASLRSDHPAFRSGDTLKVHVKVVEGNKTRVQVFQGIVIARSGSGVQETFTVRKVSYGVGVERTFPLHTPIIDRIELVSRGDVRRAKLYYLRELRGKAAKIREKRDAVPSSGNPSTGDAAGSSESAEHAGA